MVTPLDLMVTGERPSEQVARICSLFHIDLLPLPNFAPFCFSPFLLRDTVIMCIGSLVERGYSSRVLGRR